VWHLTPALMMLLLLPHIRRLRLHDLGWWRHVHVGHLRWRLTMVVLLAFLHDILLEGGHDVRRCRLHHISRLPGALLHRVPKPLDEKVRGHAGGGSSQIDDGLHLVALGGLRTLIVRLILLLMLLLLLLPLLLTLWRWVGLPVGLAVRERELCPRMVEGP